MFILKRCSLIFLVLFATLGAAALPALADCPDGTAGDDIINCDITDPNKIVRGDAGADVITIEAGATVDIVGGDATYTSTPPNGSTKQSNDTIINNGTVISFIAGDYADNFDDIGGDDTIINNGTTGDIYADNSGIFGKGGDDTVVNNGEVTVSIWGDRETNKGNDTITNNGVVGDSIYGDGLENGGTTGNDTITNNGNVGGDITGGGGNDTIINNGVVDGSIDGHIPVTIDESDDDTIINAGSVGGDIKGGIGNDTITLVVGSSVGGTVSGGSGTDTLIFSGTTSDQAGFDQIQSFLNCSPCSGTVTLNGQTYTFNSFEALQNLLILLIESGATNIDINFAQRINRGENGAPLALYCNADSITLVDIGAGGVGSDELHFSLGALPPVASEPIVLASSNGNQLLLQPDGTLLVVGPSLDGTKTYTLAFTTDCAPLGAGVES